MIYVATKTIQLLGRRVLIKLGCLSGGMIASTLLQILPLMLIMPIIRVIANPEKQKNGLPIRMKNLFPEDLSNRLDYLIINTETKTLIIVVGVVAISIFGMQGLLTKIIKKRTIDFLNRQSHVLACKLFNNYLSADVFSYSNPIDRIRSGCNSLSVMLNGTIMSLTNIVMFAVASSILILIYPLPGMASVSIVITMLCLFSFLIQPKMEQIINQARLAESRGTKVLSDSMLAIKEIKLMGREQHFFKLYLESQKHNENIQKITEKLRAATTIINIIMRYVGLAVGIFLAIYTLPKETLATFMILYMILTMKISASVQQIIAGSKEVYNSLLVLQLHYKTMLKYDKKPNISNGSPIIYKKHIEFKNAFFRHTSEPDDDEDYEAAVLAGQQQEEQEEVVLPYVLENLNLKIRQGELVGLVGRNGSGKSTILDLLSGLIIPTEGHLLIDGVKLKSSDRKNWRQQINYVIQKPHIVSESILYNVTLGLEKDKIDHQLLENALKLSMLEDVIKKLPNGLETQVGKMGTKISGGQAQRIALARALYQDREILFLDEATRAIDAATEAEIMEKISSLRGIKTIIIVTHRVQSLRQCDNIYIIENKTLAAEGDYETLCRNNELFQLFALGKTKSMKEKQEKIPSVA